MMTAKREVSARLFACKREADAAQGAASIPLQEQDIDLSRHLARRRERGGKEFAEEDLDLDPGLISPPCHRFQLNGLRMQPV